jgi:hypothetical protein
MTLFGFVVGTTLINSLFLFDLYVTKFQQRKSLWGSTMTVVVGLSPYLYVIPFYTLIVLWFCGLLFGNFVTRFQVISAGLFWLWYITIYGISTYLYYKWKVPDLKKDNE